MNKIISGKVRDVYDNGESLIIVTSDRISAFDVVLPTPIPEKGKALNLISNFWFDKTKDIVAGHIIETDYKKMPEPFSLAPSLYADRTVMVRKLKMLKYEFIVRGYIFGNMWKAYQNGEPFCGHKITGKYEMAQKLQQPIITPSTKAEEGHDVYVSLDTLRADIGVDLTDKIVQTCIDLYNRCYTYAMIKGIIIADTKFEFGIAPDGSLVLADEIFTPDSSRFWDMKEYKIGTSPKSYDKQFVRDWLIANKMDGVTPPPNLPNDIVFKTSELYRECYRKITNSKII